jgi:hypothetical protein
MAQQPEGYMSWERRFDKLRVELGIKTLHIMRAKEGPLTYLVSGHLYVLGLKTSVLPTSIWHSQINVPVSKTGRFPPAKLIRGGRAMQGDHTLATIGAFECEADHLGEG